ncbi:MAG TPA: SH3 domain-containing protein [Clostridiaceae bacterium]|jgi:uncharacterized protein YgiM (DUF1202 family)|nr:SH3 domain-containing protein [Clostridiaceae bacterium]
MSDMKKICFAFLVICVSIFAFSSMAFADQNQVGIVTADVLNFRESPSLDAKILMQLLEGTEVQVTGYKDGWYNIVYEDVAGWVFGEYLDVVDEPYMIGVMIASDVNVRSGPSTDHYVVGSLDKGDEIKITGRSGNWYSIKYEDGLDAWVFGDYVRVVDSGSSRGNDLATRIIKYAKNLLGIKYVYGGNSPSEGLDCSGFVKYVFNHFGIDIYRVAADQATQGEYVDRSELKPGDLVFFDTNGGHDYINHVGIYVGGNEFIHASSGKGSIVISELSGFYSENYMKAKRFFR